MATFRSGFKIFGELTLRQSLGRIRSFSEDRKPGSWLPEDQWAVRPPCTTCPDPCAPKKPKATKSWLSICRDPEPPITCDIRHNNCPPPKTEDEPWYSFITKKKPEKPKPPLDACRAELQRRAEAGEEETCENLDDIIWHECYAPVPAEEPPCKEREPAPVVRLSCPPPKELDLMLWCGRPCLSVTRMASQCMTDRMPYEEFRPRKTWKQPPYSLPCKSDMPTSQPFCCNIGRAPLSEFKQVEIPKPVYTRYKSVELEDENFLLCMTDAKCPPDPCRPSLAIEPPPLRKTQPPPEEPKQEPCVERPVLVAASGKPVKLKCAPKFTFRPKPTKLVERRYFRNPCAQHSACNLMNIKPPGEEEKPKETTPPSPCHGEQPKVITSNLMDEPPTFERSIQPRKPPSWMFNLSKPGSKDTPLLPQFSTYPKEPDWCGETDGLKFYDGQNDGITPKPPPDPYPKSPETPCEEPQSPPKPKAKAVEPVEEGDKFVLMPEKYNIKNMRPPEEKEGHDLSQANFHEFIDAKTGNVKTCSKLYPQAKENILYDFIRNRPLPPLDPSKPDPPPRKPPEPDCPQPLRFYYRRYSTFAPFRKHNVTSFLKKMKSGDSNRSNSGDSRTGGPEEGSPPCDSGDSREKCKVRRLVPKPRECGPPVKGPSCNETEMPCCPKAKIPPDCRGKRQMPPCKKRLAPKPSYSECCKDPPPPQRITECNAWERKEMENSRKNAEITRKFSSWAPVEGHARDSESGKSETTEVTSNLKAMALGPSNSENSDFKYRGQSIPKPKRASHVQRKVFSGKELMLNFVNPTEDSSSYYTSDSLVGRRKREPWRKLKTPHPVEKNTEQSVGSQLHERRVITLLLQDHHTRNDARVKNLRVSHRESGLGVYVESIYPRDIFGSIRNWISGLFKVQRKRSHSVPPSAAENDQSLRKTYVETVDVDRIMKLTKPFKHSIISKDEKVTYYTVDPLGGGQLRNKFKMPLRQMRGKQWNKSLLLFPKLSRGRVSSSMWMFESLSPAVNTVSDKEEPKELHKPLRSPGKKSEECIVPAVENLSGRGVLVCGNLRERENIQTGQITGKNGFGYFPAPVTRGGDATLSRQLHTNGFLQKESSKKDTESVVATKSNTGAPSLNVLFRREYPRRTSGNGAVLMHTESSTQTGLRKVVVSSTLFVKEDAKVNRNILSGESTEEQQKRNEVRNILSKFGVRTISETTVEKRTDEVRLEDDHRTRKPFRKMMRFNLHFPHFRKTGKDVIEPTENLGDPASSPQPINDEPKYLTNRLDDVAFRIIENVDKKRNEKMKRHLLYRTLSYENLPFIPVSVNRNETAGVEGTMAKHEFGPSARKSMKVADDPTDETSFENSKNKWKDPCFDKLKKHKSGNGSNKNDDEEEGECRKTNHKKKPGPNCPDN